MEIKREAFILKVSGNTVEGVVDEVASEVSVALVVNSEPFVTLQCTPVELDKLAVGFLLSEGLIQQRTSIKKIEVLEQEPAVLIELADLPDGWGAMKKKLTVTSGCGKGVTFTTGGDVAGARGVRGLMNRSLALDDIRRLLSEFRTISKLYLETGGVHSAALSDGRDILFFSEDIGRHNAVDKLIGKAFLQSIPVEDKILLTSGRVTSEIMSKAGRNRFPILISRAAPSCMAISNAEDLGITLIGFARGDRMNIYSWPNRIRTAP